MGAAPVQTAACLTFGRSGDSQPALLEGFAAPEDGFTWSVGEGSRLALRLAPGDAGLDHLLELTLNPFVVPGRLLAQRLAVLVNGVPVADEPLQGEGTVSYRIPPRALRQDGSLEVVLRHKQACRPADLGVGNDMRRLGFMIWSLRVVRVRGRRSDVTVLPPVKLPLDRAALEGAVQAAAGLPARALALCFESLGHNCEFGLVQDHVGADPLSLLRFAGITLENLLAGLRRGFEGVGDEVVVRTAPAGGGKREFLVYDDRYSIGLHTFRTTDEATAEDVHAEHSTRLRFMRRQFARWLRSGQRVFVFQRPGQLTSSQARPLLTLLRSFGPNSLLYVDQTPGMPSGAVEQLEHGLFHGRLDRLAPAEQVGDLDLPGWMSLCVNTHRLWSASRRA